ncbi:MAG: hypothetical protein JO053_04365 [Acidobacteria bacterium]|nr:hypothetical protein [Acidobacteriota bacterium]
MRIHPPNIKRFFAAFLAVAALIGSVSAQSAAEQQFVADSSGNSSWFWMILLVVAGLGGGAFLWRKSKAGKNKVEFNYENRYRDYYNTAERYDMKDLDAEKELEWLKKAKKTGAKTTPKITYGAKAAVNSDRADTEEDSLDTKMFQEKMRKMQYAQLPINSFSALAPARNYEPLPESDDPALLNAIEQADEEMEPDEAIREIALNVLAAFATTNSVEALSQMAIYDLSSNLRSKAVSVLTEIDHESVFETIILACADPTREVRAAAARGLFRLSFDRANAWKHLIDTRDEFRMSHAARAAVESGIVAKSFERLVHEDMRIAYEAFVLVALLIKAGEMKEIFDAIKDHRDERVKFALIHTIKAIKDERSIVELSKFVRSNRLPKEVMDRANETVRNFDQVEAPVL